MIQYLGLADYLLIAEAVLDVPAEVLAMSADLALAASALNACAASFGGTEQYPDFATKVAVLGSRLCRNHALTDGNKRVAYEAMREFVARNGHPWAEPEGDIADGDETVKIMWDLAADDLTESELADWIKLRIGES